MDTEEAIELMTEINNQTRQDQHSGDLFQFVTVWIKSRKPELYKDLENEFRNQHEARIYEHQQRVPNHIEF